MPAPYSWAIYMPMPSPCQGQSPGLGQAVPKTYRPILTGSFPLASFTRLWYFSFNLQGV
jgi:hypothetical protein